MTDVTDFSAIVAVAKKGHKLPWDWGDALTDLFGAPSTDGRRDGSRKKMQTAIDAIVNTVGFCDYDDSTLARYRRVAWEFPEGVRRHDLA
jgi:hypothetical protein